MKIKQNVWRPKEGWIPVEMGDIGESAQLVLVFGSRNALLNQAVFDKIRQTYSGACIFGCSTAGEIYGSRVFDESIVVTAVEFTSSQVQGAKISLDQVRNSEEAGECLARSLAHEGLIHVFVLSDGLKVNGSDLVRGLVKVLPRHVTITGGLAADGPRFEETLVFCNSSPKKIR